MSPKLKHGLKIGFQAFTIASATMLVVIFPMAFLGLESPTRALWDVFGPASAIGLANGIMHGKDYEP